MTVAAVGSIRVGTFLLARTRLTLVDVCPDTGRSFLSKAIQKDNVWRVSWSTFAASLIMGESEAGGAAASEGSLGVLAIMGARASGVVQALVHI